jgi:hypothetical protein
MYLVNAMGHIVVWIMDIVTCPNYGIYGDFLAM